MARGRAVRYRGCGDRAFVRCTLGLIARTMHIPAGMLLSVNLKGWEHFPIRDRLRTIAGARSLYNDAGRAWEYWVGSGQQMKSLVLLNALGTGIG